MPDTLQSQVVLLVEAVILYLSAQKRAVVFIESAI